MGGMMLPGQEFINRQGFAWRDLIGQLQPFFFVDASGRVLIGYTTALGRLGQTVEITTSSNYGGMALTTFSSTAEHAPVLDLNHSKSNTKGTHALVANGDSLGYISFRGSDGTQFFDGAQIRGNVDGTPGTGDMPGMLRFITTADGASSGTERMRIDSTGAITQTGTAQAAGSFTNTGGNCIVSSNGGSGFGAFYANGSTGQHSYYFFVTNSTETARITGTSGGDMILSTGSGTTTAVTLTGANATVAGTLTATGGGNINPLTLGTEVASTSGTSIDFTGIPSWAKLIVIQFVGVSTNGTSPYIVQLGDSGGVETSGYLGTISFISNGVSPATSNVTTGIGVTQTNAGTTVVHGTVTLTLEDATNFTWVASVNIAGSDGAYSMVGASSKSLSAALDRVRITTVGGADTFDAGAINILYE